MTMVVQHLENRLSLSAINPNEQLHEFQIVHALITQCRKQNSSDESSSSSSSSENQSPKSNSLRRRSPVGCTEEKQSFVSTLRQTFNALTNNSSLCAKQNNTAHPVSIASTVKNIISQFSRQTYHGTLCIASPSSTTSTPKRVSPQKCVVTRKKVPSNKNSKNDTETSQPQSTIEESVSSVPSTSTTPTLECTPVKSAVLCHGNVSNPIATKPKTRSVRARNAHRLTRHESAPIPPPAEVKTLKRTSVRRSKSDAVCYSSKVKQNRRKIESNVQTKVLHFENCCKDQAAMCVECRKRSLEEEITSTSLRDPLPKVNSSVRQKTENYIGVLSYHKPSILSQSAAASSSQFKNDNSTPTEKSSGRKTPPPTAKRPTAVMCPGGTFFLTTETAVNNSTDIKPVAVESKNSETQQNLATVQNNNTVTQCSPRKRKRSESELDSMQHDEVKLESNSKVNTNRDCEQVNTAPDSRHAASDSLSVSFPSESLPSCDSGSNLDPDSETVDRGVNFHNDSSYTVLCEDKICDPKTTRKAGNFSDEELNLSHDDDSDATESSLSSSGESCLSPRQEYLAGNSGKATSLRRTPSTRYQKMRRKLKKLITRSKSCPEVQPMVQLSQSELERQYLESLTIPTPGFMLSRKSSFSAKRQQVAMHFDKSPDWTSRLPDHILVQIFSHMDTRSLAMLKCVCKDFQFLINSYDIRGTDSLWVKDKRYLDDPCKYCRKKFSAGDVSMCRYHAKSYHCDLPYGRSYWMCCFQIERNAPGCKTGIHDNYWLPISTPTLSPATGNNLYN